MIDDILDKHINENIDDLKTVVSYVLQTRNPKNGKDWTDGSGDAYGGSNGLKAAKAHMEEKKRINKDFGPDWEYRIVQRTLTFKVIK